MDPKNMLFRLEDLTVQKVYEEYGISEETRKQNPGLYKMFVEDFIPTREDLEREIDEDSLKELCLRLPCRVLMYRWNPVQDFVDQFTRQGRIQRWTQEKTQKLLVKAVQRHKNVCLYSDDEIRKHREKEWCERKKENLMRLEVWEYDRQQQEYNWQSEEQQYSDSSILDTAEDHDAISSQANEERAIAATVLDLDAVMAELHGTTVESTPSDDAQMQPLSQSTDTNVVGSRTTTDKGQPASLPTTQNTEELAGREYVEMVQQLNADSHPNLADYVNVNTESMQLGDSTTISQDVLIDGECTPPYCEFTTLLSITSTQSPTAK
ncbi:telomere-binding protein cav [Anastrepha ludens]|uniref:telomere-binding protein cav n=1 Tax=Anastrepha ludens TaxID=28586 RepID=UPI0023B1E68D|nr:telomere-binding protein cav [Anastrepha ludens]